MINGPQRARVPISGSAQSAHMFAQNINNINDMNGSKESNNIINGSDLGNGALNELGAWA